MDAKVIYASGWMLKISKDFNHPMLFLEWLATHRAAKMPLHKVVNDEDAIHNNLFKIRMNLHADDIRACRDYINANQLAH